MKIAQESFYKVRNKARAELHGKLYKLLRCQIDALLHFETDLRLFFDEIFII
jgi:hypothetical protein